MLKTNQTKKGDKNIIGAPTAAKATVFLETISENIIPKTVKITGSAGKEVEFRREELPNVIKVGETFFKMKIQAQGDPKAIKFPDVDNDGERNYFYDIGTEYKDILGSIDGCKKCSIKVSSLYTGCAELQQSSYTTRRVMLDPFILNLQLLQKLKMFLVLVKKKF